MNRTALCATVIVGLWSCVLAGPLPAAPDSRQAAHVRPKKLPRGIDIRALCQHWRRSYEEERPGTAGQVFRPDGSREFPPSRFRMAYKFARNGTCEWYYLSPDDAHRFKSGKWRIAASDRTVIQITADGSVSSFRVAALTRQRLVLVPIAGVPVRPGAGSNRPIRR